MSYLPTSHAYLEQSSLLLQAYPDTTRITTKYTFSTPRKSNSKLNARSRIAKSTTSTQPQSQSSQTQTQTPTQGEGQIQGQPKLATLTLKTFNPGAGICLKYRTNKAAEVGRLIMALGRLAGGETDLSFLGGATATGAQATVVAAGNGSLGDVEMGDAEDVSSATAAVTATAASGAAQAGAGKGGKAKKKGKGKK